MEEHACQGWLEKSRRDFWQMWTGAPAMKYAGHGVGAATQGDMVASLTMEEICWRTA